MIGITVEITRFVSDDQPGIVECAFVDAQGQAHTFVEKAPILTEENLWWDSKYPCAGVMPCKIEAEFTDAAGRLMIRIDTDEPRSLESASGETKFVVLSSQVVR